MLYVGKPFKKYSCSKNDFLKVYDNIASYLITFTRTPGSETNPRHMKLFNLSSLILDFAKSL